MRLFDNESFQDSLKESPIVLVDIGASGGFKATWSPMRPYLKVIGFEPDEKAFTDLRSSTGHDSDIYINTALFSRRDSIVFYLTQKQQLSSIYKPNRRLLDHFSNPDRFDVIKEKTIEVDTLDNQLEEKNVGDVDFIKMDTQGSELPILHGSEKILSSTVFGLEIEVEFMELYENQPLFPEVDEYVTGLGFQLFDIRPCYWRRSPRQHFPQTKGQTVFGDAIYFRSIETIQAMLKGYPSDEQKKNKVLRMIPVCIAYHHPDYAAEIVASQKDLFPADEYSHILHSLSKSRKGKGDIGIKIPNFRGRGKLADLAYKIWKTIQPNYWKCRLYLHDGQQIEKF